MITSAISNTSEHLSTNFIILLNRLISFEESLLVSIFSPEHFSYSLIAFLLFSENSTFSESIPFKRVVSTSHSFLIDCSTAFDSAGNSVHVSKILSIEDILLSTVIVSSN